MYFIGYCSAFSLQTIANHFLFKSKKTNTNALMIQCIKVHKNVIHKKHYLPKYPVWKYLNINSSLVSLCKARKQVRIFIEYMDVKMNKE